MGSLGKQPAYYRGPWVNVAGGNVAKKPILLPMLPPPTFLPDPFCTREENQAAREAHRHFYQQAENRLKQAFLEVSQGPTGRALLTAAQREGYRVMLAPKEWEQAGSCDRLERIIFIHPEAPVGMVASTLDHECAHARLGEWGDMAQFRNMDLPTQINMMRAIEADAYALEVQSAFERAHGDAALGYAGAHPRQALFGRSLKNMRRMPERQGMLNSFMRHLSQNGAVTGRALAAAHEAFYQSTPDLNFYDAQLVKLFTQYAKDMATVVKAIKGKDQQRAMADHYAQKGIFQQNTPLEHIRRHLTWLGKPYLDRFATTADLTQDKYTAMGRADWNALRNQAYRVGVPEAGVDDIPLRDDRAAAPFETRLWHHRFAAIKPKTPVHRS